MTWFKAGDDATRAAIFPTLLRNPYIDTVERADRVLSALVRFHSVFELADDANKPGECDMHNLGVWLAMTDHVVQRLREIDGGHRVLRDVVPNLFHQSSPCSVCGAPSVGEPPAAGDASSDPAAGEGVTS